MKMETRLLMAIDLATTAHKGQLRKYTGEPYIVHPFAVAGLVRSVTDNDDMLIAALLHDVVEDTSVTLRTILGIFGETVSGLVDELTDPSKPTDGNRRVRKGLDLLHTASASKEAKTIKLADLIDNTKTIVACDVNFARVYMAEKKKLLAVLTEGDKFLYDLAMQQVENFYK
jgi:(p)ppGpp synthase/HD superfamily hydrolase